MKVLPGTYVEWWPLEEPHGHRVILSMPGENMVDIDTEESASELAEAVLICNDTRHNQHGRRHTHQDAEDAFNIGLQQLFTHDYKREFKERARRTMLYRKWGGHVPEAMLLPDEIDPREWRLVMPDAAGNPVAYKIDEKKVGIGDVIPIPNKDNAYKTERGWEAKPPAETILNRRMQRKMKGR